jgi:hypothetical protein
MPLYFYKMQENAERQLWGFSVSRQEGLEPARQSRSL